MNSDVTIDRYTRARSHETTHRSNPGGRVMFAGHRRPRRSRPCRARPSPPRRPSPRSTAATRMITLKKPDGEVRSVIVAPPEVKRFAEIKVGDTITAKYTENMILRVMKPGEAAVNSATGGVAAGAGARPSATVTAQRSVTATITAIDPAVPSITLTGPDKTDLHRQGRRSRGPETGQGRGSSRHHLPGGGAGLGRSAEEVNIRAITGSELTMKRHDSQDMLAAAVTRLPAAGRCADQDPPRRRRSPSPRPSMPSSTPRASLTLKKAGQHLVTIKVPAGVHAVRRAEGRRQDQRHLLRQHRAAREGSPARRTSTPRRRVADADRRHEARLHRRRPAHHHRDDHRDRSEDPVDHACRARTTGSTARASRTRRR